MKCQGSSETHFGKVSRRFEPSLRSKRPSKVCEHFQYFDVLSVEKENVRDRLKRILAKFEDEWSHVRCVDVDVDMVNIFAEISVAILAQGSLA